MEQLLQSLSADHPDIHFVAGKTFYWSPTSQEVFYKYSSIDQSSLWSLLHETGHALLGHTRYVLDFELLQLELAAWQKASELAECHGIAMDTDHIENCLDSYRDWLHRRSICPSCGTQALQIDEGSAYRCYNCQNTWKVTPSRFCRPYRQGVAKTKSPATFR